MLFKVFAFLPNQDGNLQALSAAPCPLHPAEVMACRLHIQCCPKVDWWCDIRPAFRQPQAFLHPFLQLQDIIFKRDSGDASLSILRGKRPNRAGTQPHSRGFFSCPNHFCI
ncbi:hypothetical protein AVEN_147766-1 [Araneus ventricosus]|uniref:Uncharacterized protein n=1 Tax=Araneus ventricosus TaxID=182803 RepID=A0A4Y2RN13_ARAVE|nr:hypothetical protein AVEN_147766-1 [Araneus ventricosus]